MLQKKFYEALAVVAGRTIAVLDSSYETGLEMAREWESHAHKADHRSVETVLLRDGYRGKIILKDRYCQTTLTYGGGTKNELFLRRTYIFMEGKQYKYR